MANTLTNLVDIVDSLAAADARSILVPNIPNLGLVPLITGGGPEVAEATALSSMFNTELAGAMDSLAAAYPDTKLFELDVFSLFTDAYDNPAAYGFTNVTDGCYSELVITGGTICQDPSEFLSWDGFHPTTTAHEFLAGNVVIPIPAAVWLFISGIISLAAFSRRKAHALYRL
jgi:phospholipase/lecithinase/hemolysin